jgi:acetyl esterase/lipase
MPGLRARIFRSIAKYSLGARFKKAGTSLEEWRKIDDFIARYASVPAGTKIEPIMISGLKAEWIQAEGVKDKGAVLYLHGGGFIMGSPVTHRELAARLSATSQMRCLVLDYRLSPEHPFPAAMQDTIAAYRWLRDNGVAESNIVIGGDSAGGGLALQALISLRDQKCPLPAAAFLLSPPLDWVRFDGDSYRTRADVDPLITREMCILNGGHYVGDNDPETPLLYPIGMDLSGLPPLCVHVGDNEVLLSDSVRLVERARSEGVEVEFKIWPGMWHVFQGNARYVPESRQSLQEVGQFIRKRSPRLKPP